MIKNEILVEEWRRFQWELNRLPRSASPDHFKKHGGNPLFNEILGGHGGHGVYEGNYGGHGGYPIGGYNIGYGGHPGGYSGQAQAQAQAGAIAGGHGGASAISQAQSQSASFGFGPFSATSKTFDCFLMIILNYFIF
ncbi:uncharacterized protein [Euwallacea similis]|uniref:uncharacterized protein isoform X2 n=1 Tax=Euwallacea similis TaxID=1736056 RepID=UPI00344CB1BB